MQEEGNIIFIRKNVLKLAVPIMVEQTFVMLLGVMAGHIEEEAVSAGLKGAGDTRYTMMTAFIGMWIFRVGLGYMLGIQLDVGIIGIWIAMYIDWVIRGTMYSFRLKGNKWLMHRL